MDTFPEQTIDEVLNFMSSVKLILTFTKITFVHIGFYIGYIRMCLTLGTIRQLISKLIIETFCLYMFNFDSL